MTPSLHAAYSAHAPFGGRRRRRRRRRRDRYQDGGGGGRKDEKSKAAPAEYIGRGAVRSVAVVGRRRRREEAAAERSHTETRPCTRTVYTCTVSRGGKGGSSSPFYVHQRNHRTSLGLVDVLVGRQDKAAQQRRRVKKTTAALDWLARRLVLRRAAGASKSISGVRPQPPQPTATAAMPRSSQGQVTRSLNFGGPNCVNSNSFLPPFFSRGG